MPWHTHSLTDVHTLLGNFPAQETLFCGGKALLEYIPRLAVVSQTALQHTLSEAADWNAHHTSEATDMLHCQQSSCGQLYQSHPLSRPPAGMCANRIETTEITA